MCLLHFRKTRPRTRRPRPRPRTWPPRPRPRTWPVVLKAPQGQGHGLEDSISALHTVVAVFSYIIAIFGSGGSTLGPGGTAPKSCPSPQFLIGSIVILLSRCCLPNDEGPGPQVSVAVLQDIRKKFFLYPVEPPLVFSDYNHWFQRLKRSPVWTRL